MSEIELLRKENMKLKQDIEYHIRKEREMMETILILKAKVIDIKNHQMLGINEDTFDAYCKILKKED